MRKISSRTGAVHIKARGLGTPSFSHPRRVRVGRERDFMFRVAIQYEVYSSLRAKRSALVLVGNEMRTHIGELCLECLALCLERFTLPFELSLFRNGTRGVRNMRSGCAQAMGRVMGSECLLLYDRRGHCPTTACSNVDDSENQRISSLPSIIKKCRTMGAEGSG